jgi:hypothetical protein
MILLYNKSTRRPRVTISDFTNELEQAVESGEWQSGYVAPEDFNTVTHRLRYQAKKLGLEIEIRTNKQEGKVSFKCRMKAQTSIS